MSNGIVADTLIARGRYQVGLREVTSAELVLTDGLLVIEPDAPSSFVVIEAGAILRGITVVSQSGDDLTDSDLDLVTLLTVVASDAVPYTITVEHEATVEILDPTDRLWIPSVMIPGTFGDGTIGQHPRVFAWRPDIQRWAVPQTAT